MAVLGLWAGAVSAQPGEQAPAMVLRFSEFFAGPLGNAGLQPTDKLLAANGQRVRITGYMVTQEFPRPGRFFLTPRPRVRSSRADAG